MTIKYVHRTNGSVDGVFANKQPDYAEEALDDSDPAIQTYFNPPKVQRRHTTKNTAKANLNGKNVDSLNQSDQARLLAALVREMTEWVDDVTGNILIP